MPIAVHAVTEDAVDLLEQLVVVRAETDAEINPWMLGINEAMGFRTHARYRAFQGDLEGARAIVS